MAHEYPGLLRLQRQGKKNGQEKQGPEVPADHEKINDASSHLCPPKAKFL
jgi:hypothetical protein